MIDFEQVNVNWDLRIYWFLVFSVSFNPLRLKAAGLFKYVWPFCYHQALKG